MSEIPYEQLTDEEWEVIDWVEGEIDRCILRDYREGNKIKCLINNSLMGKALNDRVMKELNYRYGLSGWKKLEKIKGEGYKWDWDYIVLTPRIKRTPLKEKIRLFLIGLINNILGE